jgi:hypothetical protein
VAVLSIWLLLVVVAVVMLMVLFPAVGVALAA